MADKEIKDEILEDEELDQSFITVDGKDVPIQVLLEFEREENGKQFVFYSEINDDDTDETKEFKVAEIKTMEDGSKELFEVEDEDDMAYCEERFDEIVEEMQSYSLSDDLEEDEETEGEDILS